MYIAKKKPTVPSGPFHGPLVVSMRPMDPSLHDRAKQITRQFPGSHGAPIHVGDPSVLGIEDINNPDFGDAVTINEGEEPVFWACGVTPQVAMEDIDEWISHSPGCMLVTDIQNEVKGVMY